MGSCCMFLSDFFWFSTAFENKVPNISKEIREKHFRKKSYLGVPARNNFCAQLIIKIKSNLWIKKNGEFLHKINLTIKIIFRFYSQRRVARYVFFFNSVWELFTLKVPRGKIEPLRLAKTTSPVTQLLQAGIGKKRLLRGQESQVQIFWPD